MTKDGNSGRLLSSSPNTDGGPGSGNFGHAGRPGEVGGSAETHGAIETNPKPTKQYASKDEYRKTTEPKKQSYLRMSSEIRSDMDSFYERSDRELEEIRAKADKLNADRSMSDYQRSKLEAKLIVDKMALEDMAVLKESRYEGYLQKALLPYDNAYDPYYEFSAVQGSHSIEDDSSVDVINPKKLKYNCQRCVIAYELRRRGYDVTASEGDGGYLADDTLLKICFKDSEITEYGKKTFFDCTDSIKKQMLKYGNGSRSIISISGPDNGHVINAEVVDGEVFGIDSQNGIVSPIDEMYRSKRSGVHDMDWSDEVELIRVDNTDVTAASREYVQEVKNNG